MTNKCPSCGEPVPSNSLTCPRCYASIPRREEKPIKEKPVRKTVVKSKLVSILLAVLPAPFGLLGLGLIYEDYKDRRGWAYLIFGLVVYVMLITFIMLWARGEIIAKVLSTVMAFIMAIVYISAFFAQIAETKFGSIFKMFRF